MEHDPVEVVGYFSLSALLCVRMYVYHESIERVEKWARLDRMIRDHEIDSTRCLGNSENRQINVTSICIESSNVTVLLCCFLLRLLVNFSFI